MYDESYGPKRFSNTDHCKCANSGKTVTGTVK